ncbi:MAG TPA: D-glucuronyl C5-epimerase family protein [Terriglobales bacterium]|nr:D-glucuronyl C5-epimerase family protein [Terriglobales bacterium]
MNDSRKPPHALRYALRALRREIFEFSFTYPLELDLAAGPRDSLHYYTYSEKLEWSIMRMDTNGIPRVCNRLTGIVYKPAYIAWWGLINLGHYLRHRDEASRENFLKQVDWLEAHAVTRSDGAVVWELDWDILHGPTLLRAPWVSCYDQGLVISALVRGYRLTGRRQLLELLKGTSRIFALECRDGGVRDSLPSGAVYSELPGQPVPGIQDGFMSSLLGLFDLYVETGDPAVKRLFDDGITGLKASLPVWNYRDKWSWYGARGYFCPPSYHWLNRLLLQSLARLTGEPSLSGYAEAWNPARLTALGKAEIYLGFQLTKNAARIRNRTWRLNAAKVRALARQGMKPPAREAAVHSAADVLPQYERRGA